jgi:hypothetical protein
MLTEQYLDVVYNKLIADESFCRLVYYGNNPFGEDKDDITMMSNHKDIMENSIRFSPGLDDLQENEVVRVCLYKEYTKLRVDTSAVRLETLQFDIFVPHRLVREDKRVYKIENKIASLIDGMPLGIGYLDYVNGSFVKIPNVSGYAMYKMTFSMEEGRRISYGKL